MTEASGEIRAYSNFPIPTVQDRTRLLSELGDGNQIVVSDEAEAQRLVNLFIGAILISCETILPALTVNQLASPTGVLVAMSRIQTVSFSDVWRTEINNSSATIEGSLSRLNEQVERSLSTVTARSADLERLEKRSAGLEEVLKAQNEAIGTHKETLTTFEHRVTEQLKLQKAGELWKGRATATAWAFWLSAIILTAILVGIPTWLFVNRSQILEFVHEIDLPAGVESIDASAALVAQGIAAIGRLALVTAPLGFAVWLIRFLMRYNMRSLLLMDDARQRVAMLDTYFLLVEKGAADPKTDRGVVLEALFRRAPGHGSDGAEPPQFADLMKLADHEKRS